MAYPGTTVSQCTQWDEKSPRVHFEELVSVVEKATTESQPAGADEFPSIRH